MTIRVADHPRAAAGVRRARAGAGLAGFALAGVLAHRAGLPAFDVLLRALVAGVAAHVAGWALAIAWWRGAIMAELEEARARREAELEEARKRREAEQALREAADEAESRPA